MFFKILLALVLLFQSNVVLVDKIASIVNNEIITSRERVSLAFRLRLFDNLMITAGQYLGVGSGRMPIAFPGRRSAPGPPGPGSIRRSRVRSPRRPWCSSRPWRTTSWRRFSRAGGVGSRRTS